ncbi:MAG: branched-chain amino acid ABC transporter permease [Hydrogenophaga sp.]|uniref:branched-chain amino acid ABC transporter permease n=1 Tax=Hydrogenophaga sp. TaxID=1904254 RepID=UPI004035FAE0
MSTFVIGLSIGMLLFLLAAGLTLIFGMLRIINFAHGALYMLGAYLAFQIAWWAGFWWAIALVPVLLALVGVLIERLTLRPIYSAPHEFQLLITFGLILVLEEVVRATWGLSGKSIAVPPWLSGSVALFDTDVSRYRLFVIAVGATTMAVLLLGIERSRIGLVIRSCSTHPLMAATLGVRVDRVRTAVFAVGAALAGLGGAMAGPMLPIQLQMGGTIILDCFIVVIIGGLGNIRGAMVGALLIGMTRAFGQQYLPDWIDTLTYAVLIATLLLRPQGLFSKKERLA